MRLIGAQAIRRCNCLEVVAQLGHQLNELEIAERLLTLE